MTVTSGRLADFVVDRRMLVTTALALPIGALSAAAAWGLLKLIGLVTNLVFYQRWSYGLVAPGAQHHPWWLILGAPVAGGLVVGVMARFGSDKIRGHGMPEAIEAILTRGSRIEPKVAILKPVSAAISIGRDLLAARMHDLTEDTERTRHLIAFGRRPAGPPEPPVS